MRTQLLSKMLEQLSFLDSEVDEVTQVMERSAKEQKEFDEWRRKKKEAKARFTAMQSLPYKVKVKRAELRAIEFMEQMEERGCNAHVSVGGLDSITLLMFLRHIGIDIPAISVSGVEDKSIQRVHKDLGIESVKSYKSKVEVLNEVGFPVISKKIAGRIDLLQHPSPDNETVRHAIMTGECGEQGHYAKNSRMKLPLRWLKLFGGVENEKYNTDYQVAPFQVSNKCCYYLKEKPCDDWAKEYNSWPFLGIMASEGGQREEALIDHGCNYYGKTVIRSAPFAPFLRRDVLQQALDLNVPVPEIYGEIRKGADVHDKSPEDGLQHVWVRNSLGAASTPVRPTAGDESPGMAILDV